MRVTIQTGWRVGRAGGCRARTTRAGDGCYGPGGPHRLSGQPCRESPERPSVHTGSPRSPDAGRLCRDPAAALATRDPGAADRGDGVDGALGAGVPPRHLLFLGDAAVAPLPSSPPNAWVRTSSRYDGWAA